MTQRYGDMVQESISAPGTSAFTLGTPSTGFLAFSTIPSITTNDTVDYLAIDSSGSPWEVGTGTYSAGSLARTTVLINSSGTTSTVNFTGTTYVSNTLTAERFKIASNKPPVVAQVYTSGSGTYTPSAGVTYITVEMVGGGGGGGGSGNTPSAGNNGGSTTFGSSFLVAGGGGGAPAFYNGSGGTASIGSGATGFAQTGAMGGTWQTINAISTYAGQPGGGTRFGTSTLSINSPANTGVGGAGGGMSGGATNTGAGGGAGGYVYAIVPAPASSYSYAIGAGGTGGATGSGGSGLVAGFNGGSGLIIITEHFGS